MEAEAVETLEGRHGLTARVYPDWEARNPREEFDHLGTLAQKDIGEEASGAVWAGENLEDDIRAMRFDGATVLPIRYSDYGSSGARIQEADADDANGYIYVSAADLEREYCTDDRAWTDHAMRAARRNARKVLRGELAELDAVMQGEVYGYSVTDWRGEVVDSCWGFIGEYSPKAGEWYVLQEAREALEAAEEAEDKRRADTARGWAEAIAKLAPADALTHWANSWRGAFKRD